MSNFYDDINATALALVKEFGAPIGLGRLSTVSFDPVTSSQTTPTVSFQNVQAVVLTLGVTSRKWLEERLIESLVAGRLRKVVISAVGCPFVPLPNDILSFDNEWWQVIIVSTVSPAGTDIIYNIIAEKRSQILT